MTRATLIHKIASLLRKGDQSKERSDAYYLEAGKNMHELKQRHDAEGGTWAQWEELVRLKFGIGRTRASELMQMATGKKTVQETRDNTKARTRKTRKKKKKISPLRSGEILVEGRDGKLRPLPKAEQWWNEEIRHKDGDSDEVIWRRGLIFRSRAAAGAAMYEDWSAYEVDDELLATVTKAVEAWGKLAAYLGKLKRARNDKAA